jgi:crotonobetainyl-CoA:carnitine CoA-transferase CaiB-like acyl-CoA transferase
MAGPLHGIKIIDISAIISGPMACQILADQGADVVKVEPLGTGDMTRLGGFRVGTVSAMYSAANRGKHSLAIDLSKPAGIAAIHKLAETADVFVQNFRPGAAERMGIGPDELRKINPNLIYVSISGFGPTGPYSNWRVYDPIVQAITGVISIQQSRDIPIPDLVRTLICDKSTATFAAQAITAALFARLRGDAAGQHLVIPMLDSALYWLWPDTMMGHSLTGPNTPGPLLYQIYRLQPTSDGHLVYIAIGPSEWEGLCSALGHPEWWSEPRFHDVNERIKAENFEAVGELLNSAFLEFTTEEAVAALHHHEVPCAPILNNDEVFTDPQVLHNESVHTWEHPTAGPIRQAKPPVRWETTIHETVWATDELGQSSEAILRGLGYDDDALGALRADGVIA